jgi:hypothetical protein
VERKCNNTYYTDEETQNSGFNMDEHQLPSVRCIRFNLHRVALYIAGEGWLPGWLVSFVSKLYSSFLVCNLRKVKNTLVIFLICSMDNNSKKILLVVFTELLR